MLQAGFEPTILVSERPQTHALAATGIGGLFIYGSKICVSTEFSSVVIGKVSVLKSPPRIAVCSLSPMG